MASMKLHVYMRSNKECRLYWTCTLAIYLGTARVDLCPLAVVQGQANNGIKQTENVQFPNFVRAALAIAYMYLSRACIELSAWDLSKLKINLRE